MLFDTLGPPWPRHFDNCIGQKILNVQGARNLSVGDVEVMVRAGAESLGTVIPSKVQNIFQALKFQQTGTPTVLTLTPGIEEKAFSGTVRDINPFVNVLKHLEVTDNHVTRGLLKDQLKEPHGRLVVRGPVNPKNGLCPQIEAFIPTSMLERGKIARFTDVTMRLVPKGLAGMMRFWVVKKIAAVVQ